ncbi:glutamate decarboxylase [Linnemannia elongata AG-77]|uniref:Glutamate decarboxylase n=1 Tax=Linnemannia elongata AG-77 TaxID=1314771 RepID=A0A197JMP1_9FUNG|nr:glutamate decarboxylase [Linnemannia elongata AG-77]
MSFLTRYLKSITKVKRPDTHSPTGATNAAPALEHSSRLTLQQVSKPRLAEQSTDAQAAYQFVHDSLELDSRPNMNMASYVHTWMEPEADKLIMENINKNLCDQGEYPATTEIHRRCISIIGDLWNSNDAVGSSTVGSSEAVHLGGIAMKKRWQQKRMAEGKDTSRPNIIMGHNAQAALEKFARYFDVECRMIPVSLESRYCLDVKKAAEACDENTIGVYVILGSLFTGHFEDVQGMSDELDRIHDEKGWDIPIHVDAASGGFIAPFAFPNLKWSFELDRVKSINASGHKFGLAYAGIGWVLWRSEEYLPKELVLTIDYMGAEVQTSYTLNFSRPACFMIAQYYNFVRHGREGYTSIMQTNFANSRTLSLALEESGYFDVISDIHRPKGVYEYHRNHKAVREDGIEYNPGSPCVAFKLTDKFRTENPHVKQSDVSKLMHTRGWVVPNYTLPPAQERTEAMRIVIRESLSKEMLKKLIIDIIWTAVSLAENREE